MGTKTGKLLTGKNILVAGALALGGYFLYTRVVQPRMMGGSAPPSPSPKAINKLRGPPSGLDPYSGVANDGTPTVYQPDWGPTA